MKQSAHRENGIVPTRHEFFFEFQMVSALKVTIQHTLTCEPVDCGCAAQKVAYFCGCRIAVVRDLLHIADCENHTLCTGASAKRNESEDQSFKQAPVADVAAISACMSTATFCS